MFAVELFAQNYSSGFAGARKINNFVCRAFGINRNTAGAGFQNAKVAHAPFRGVVTDKHHAVARFDSMTGEKSRRARGQFTKISVRVLLFVTVALDTHGDPGGVA